MFLVKSIQNEKDTEKLNMTQEKLENMIFAIPVSFYYYHLKFKGKLLFDTFINSCIYPVSM